MVESEHEHCRKCSTCESWFCDSEYHGGCVDVEGRWYCSRLCRYGARKLKERSDY